MFFVFESFLQKRIESVDYFHRKGGGVKLKKCGFSRGGGAWVKFTHFLRYFFLKRILSYFIQYLGWVGEFLAWLIWPFPCSYCQMSSQYPPLKLEYLLPASKTLSFFGLEGHFQGKIGDNFFPPKCVLTPKDHFQRHFYFPHFRGERSGRCGKNPNLFFLFFEGFPYYCVIWFSKFHLFWCWAKALDLFMKKNFEDFKFFLLAGLNSEFS